MKKYCLANYIFLSLIVFLLPNNFNIALAREPQMAEDQTAILFFANEKKYNNDFSVDIMVDPGGQAINAVGFTIYFNNKIISANDIDIKNSFCELFIQKEFVNKEVGRIDIACGKPYPGIDKTAPVATVNFSVLTSGWADLKFDENAMVLANDGLGTNILSEINNSSYRF